MLTDAQAQTQTAKVEARLADAMAIIGRMPEAAMATKENGKDGGNQLSMAEG